MLTLSPENLSKVATHYRYLASSCMTRQAREPLNAVAELLEQEAEQRLLVRQGLIGSGRK